MPQHKTFPSHDSFFRYLQTFFHTLRLGITFTGLAVKCQQIQPAQPHGRVDDPGDPSDPEKGFHKIKVEKSDQSPIYGADYTDRERCYIQRFHKNTSPLSLLQISLDILHVII